jgi:hypothetical protein
MDLLFDVRDREQGIAIIEKALKNKEILKRQVESQMLQLQEDTLSYVRVTLPTQQQTKTLEDAVREAQVGLFRSAGREMVRDMRKEIPNEQYSLLNVLSQAESLQEGQLLRLTMQEVVGSPEVVDNPEFLALVLKQWLGFDETATTSAMKVFSNQAGIVLTFTVPASQVITLQFFVDPWPTWASSRQVQHTATNAMLLFIFLKPGFLFQLSLTE